MHRLLIALSFLLLALQPLHAATALDPILKEGQELLSAGRFAEAEACFQKAIKLAPNDQEAWRGYKAAVSRRSPVAPPRADPARSTRMAELLRSMRQNRKLPPPKPLQLPPVSVPAPPSVSAALPQAPGAFEPIDVNELLAEAAPEGTRLRLNEHDRRPWKHFSIRTELLSSPKLARRVLDELKARYTFSYRRRVRSAVSYTCTIWNSKLYNALASIVGAGKGWDRRETDKNYTLLCKHIPDKYEFRIRITNHRAPRVILDTADIHLRTFLSDDRGHRWEVLKAVPMGKVRLTSSGEYTVWFPRYDEKGRDISTVGYGRMYLNIQGIEDGKADVRIPFKALLLRS